jgi:hypothetical protein
VVILERSLLRYVTHDAICMDISRNITGINSMINRATR